ncbi:MAG: hypothetical protein IJZ68_07110 [Bacteroidaceae bacterium]|nr:hypothetical protein [Bacteroidaceae bacterium]
MANGRNPQVSIPDDISCIRMTEQEKAAFDAILPLLDYECGEDGWVPTVREIDEKLIGRYQAKVREKMMIALSPAPDRKKMTECDAELKNMWKFMYWIVETCLDMESEAYVKLAQFVDSKIKIVR